MVVELPPAASIVAAMATAWVGGTVLLWIARPAADAKLPDLTSWRALIELAVGAIAAAAMGTRGLLLLATVFVVVRGAKRYSYEAWGGIRPASVLWTRVLLACVSLLIALLPEPSR